MPDFLETQLAIKGSIRLNREILVRPGVRS